jgi:phage terminase large subunit-like protein
MKQSEINREVAQKAVYFIQQLRHSKGKWAGLRFILANWQREQIIEPLFGTLNPDGSRQYRTCYIELPRKNGKTTLAAGITNKLLFADGEMGAEIYSAANDREQATFVFNEAAAMVKQEPRLYRWAKILDAQKRIVVHRTNSFYHALSSETYTKWGLNAHGVIYDELHAAPNRELWDALSTSQGSRWQPLIVVITTAGYDRHSICWKLHDYACKVRDGIIEDPTFLPVIYAAPEDADWTDEAVWAKCNPALGSFRSIDEMRTWCNRAKENPAEEMTFRRLYLNQWTGSVERWMPMDKWDACGGKVGDLAGKTCYAGLDLSATTDLTALALVFPGKDCFEVLMHFWIPGETAAKAELRDRVPYRAWGQQGFITLTEGDVIDYGYIHQTLKQYREQYNISEIAFDRWGASKLVQDLMDDSFTVIPFGQGYASMNAPTKELMNLVLTSKIRHGGHPVLRWNADNMVVAQDPAGNLKPDKAKATQKIDGMVALIMALDRAVKHANAEAPSIYENKDLLIL